MMQQMNQEKNVTFIELEELLPDLPTNVFYLGTLLNDDRRLMDLTDEIVDEDSHFLVQRLDRLYLALMPQWGSIKIGRQAYSSPMPRRISPKTCN